ncbi:uncharacterized protein LOC114332852 [Diabrotica virgifera virgifera]|uniref:27 kDa hemolymph protein-like n=1 Tax=Diabrotica virgifera virgifera TaxID=50390 RepID=A0ABM5IPW6_DIAVI|nr:uncharacterized protein LOC114332852 [Diabrotica virgifera virgifera]
MKLLGKVLVTLLIGCAYTLNLNKREDFGNLNQPGVHFGNSGTSSFGGRGNNPFGSVGNSQANANFMQAQSMLAQLSAMIKQKCEQTGHSDVFQTFQAQFEQTTKCMEGKINLNGNVVGEDFSNAARTNQLPNFFKKYCKLWPDVHGCTQPIVTSIEKCLNSDEKRAVEESVSLLDDTNNFFCENNADRSIRLLNGNIVQCLQTVGREIQECATNLAQKRQTHQSGRKSLFPYDEEDCSDFKTGRQCINSKLTKCESKDPSKIFDDYFAMVQGKVCRSASSLS